MVNEEIKVSQELPEDKNEGKKTKGKNDVPSLLKAVGLEACKLNNLSYVWVTSDGQSFQQEIDAQAHAANLTKKGIIKVLAE